MSADPQRRPEPHIREMRVRDLPRVIEIERASYPTPWPRRLFMDELARPSSLCLAADDGEPVGYLIAATYAEVWHILNVCVAPERRGEGIGTLLLGDLFARGEGHAHRGFTLEVRVSNAPAIQLYRTMGFLEYGIRPGYYSDNREDAIIMWRGGDPE